MTVLDRLPPAVAAKIQPEPMSGCWLWEGALVGGGYGPLGPLLDGLGT